MRLAADPRLHSNPQVQHRLRNAQPKGPSHRQAQTQTLRSRIQQSTGSNIQKAKTGAATRKICAQKLSAWLATAPKCFPIFSLHHQSLTTNCLVVTGRQDTGAHSQSVDGGVTLALQKKGTNQQTNHKKNQNPQLSKSASHGLPNHQWIADTSSTQPQGV